MNFLVHASITDTASPRPSGTRGKVSIPLGTRVARGDDCYYCCIDGKVRIYRYRESVLQWVRELWCLGMPGPKHHASWYIILRPFVLAIYI